MILSKRECIEYIDGEIRCDRDGFWYSDTGIIVRWVILSSIFAFFVLWFVGGYIHAKRRMRKGLPLLAYHRFLIPARHRSPYANHPPQNHFTFYNPNATPYAYPPNHNSPFPTPSPDAYNPPPTYHHDAPPSYFGPPAQGNGVKGQQVYQQQGQQQQGVEMGMYGQQTQGQQGQESGVVRGDVEQGQSAGAAPAQQELPPRPAQARVAIGKVLGRFRR